jgi:acetyl-CoA C-acetyltransferase
LTTGEPHGLASSAKGDLMTIRGKAFIAGAYEHPLREIPDRSTSQIHAEVAAGALADAGLTFADVDGYFCDASAGFGPVSMTDFLGLRPRHVDSTETGGSSYIVHVGHAAEAIAAGKCSVALVTMAGRPRTAAARRAQEYELTPDMLFEDLWGLSGAVTGYALAAQRHMHEFGTTSAQLAEIKVAASRHAQHNPHAFLRKQVTVEEVLAAPMISTPLRRDDCCVVTDGGGAVVIVSEEVARNLSRPVIKVLGQGEAVKHADNGRIDLTYTGAVFSGPPAFAEAGVRPADIDYASIYDSFTITVLETIEDLGFCDKGAGGAFVCNGGLVAPDGRLPVNTDGGGLCNNHPSGRGGMTKIIEAVRQLRGEAHPAVQVRDCELALVHGTGGSLGSRMGSATMILGRADA